MRQITIAIDSFKGSLSSREAAEAFAEGFSTCHPDCVIRKVTIADGGEGTVEAIVETLGGKYITLEVHDPLMRPTKACYGLIDGGTTAVIEMASASGLPLLHPDERNPWLTSTYGTGEMIADAVNRGCRKFLIGIGGSATNDGGMGLLQALGYRFLDAEGELLEGRGATLGRVASIDGSRALAGLATSNFIVACDVTSPLCGPTGAAHIFAPQKGADAAMVERLDKGMRNYADVVEQFCGRNIANMAGAGAAGGLGGGLYALLGAELRPGIDMVLEAMRFDEIVAGSDLVITGEGHIDHQTVMGKAPSGVLRYASAQGIPTIAIGGAVTWCDALEHSGFAAILPITSEAMPLEEAMRPSVARENVRRTAHRVARLIEEEFDIRFGPSKVANPQHTKRM